MRDSTPCDHDHDAEDTSTLQIKYHQPSPSGEEQEGSLVCFLPTECGVPEKLHRAWGTNGNRPYVISTPEAVLLNDGIVARTLDEIGRIAHATHFQFILPRGSNSFTEEGESPVRNIIERLQLKRPVGASVGFIEPEDDGLSLNPTDENVRTMLATLCVDQRMSAGLPAHLRTINHEIAARFEAAGMSWTPVKYARFRHPASSLLWHPEVLEYLSQEHQLYIQETIAEIRRHKNWLINTIINHIGKDGATGCGGINKLRRLGFAIDSLTEQIRYLEEVREKYHDIMTTNAEIKMDVVSGTGENMKVERVSVDDFERDQDGNVAGEEHFST